MQLLRFSEIALALVRLDRVARCIVNVNCVIAFISLCRCRVESKTGRIRRVKYWQAILILALAIATVCEAQSPLDAPGEKKVIVCSEIARAAAEIFADRYVSKCGMNLACLEARFDELITNSKSRQKDSDGFMLGARTEQVNEIDSVAHNDTRELFNTHEEIVSAYNLCREYVTEIRKLQKRLGIDDDTLLSAIDVWNSQDVTRMKEVLASYDGAR